MYKASSSHHFLIGASIGVFGGFVSLQSVSAQCQLDWHPGDGLNSTLEALTVYDGNLIGGLFHHRRRRRRQPHRPVEWFKLVCSRRRAEQLREGRVSLQRPSDRG